MTVRQTFYALEVAGIVEKTEAGYRQVQKQVLRMRREDILPWEFITDGTRWQRKPESFDTVEDAIVEHVDMRSWAIQQSIEHEEREVLYELVRQAA